MICHSKLKNRLGLMERHTFLLHYCDHNLMHRNISQLFLMIKAFMIHKYTLTFRIQKLRTDCFMIQTASLPKWGSMKEMFRLIMVSSVSHATLNHFLVYTEGGNKTVCVCNKAVSWPEISKTIIKIGGKLMNITQGKTWSDLLSACWTSHNRTQR